MIYSSAFFMAGHDRSLSNRVARSRVLLNAGSVVIVASTAFSFSRYRRTCGPRLG